MCRWAETSGVANITLLSLYTWTTRIICVCPVTSPLGERVAPFESTYLPVLGALATHLYDEPVTNVGKMEPLAEQHGLPLWMTEFSLSGMGSAGRPADPFAWAPLMHELISDYDVSAVDYMWGFFGEWEGNSSMLVTLNHTGSTYDGYTLNKTYYTTGQFSRFVDPGAERIAAQAFLNDDGELVIVAINAGGSNQQVTFDLKGLAAIEVQLW